jgi:hypothetical protein
MPVHDYGAALQSAMSWLGDRHLLAVPVPRRKEESKAHYFETHRWYVVPSKQNPPEDSSVRGRVVRGRFPLRQVS